ncbi:MAG TPA: metallophosphoesterase [Vicinamibacterales bacterium]|nr:metallophosphoesterase [Vicinamibacterales bacterium]
MRRVALFILLLLFVLHGPVSAQRGLQITLPNKPDSVKFLAMGDNGTGERAQYEVADQMAAAHKQFAFDFAIMLGDNLYGSQRPADFVAKFERPYKALLDAGVKFYASLGNHDEQNNRFYKAWNMNGERYYTYTKKNVRFFVLDSDYIDPKQLDWLTQQLKDSTDDWKIAYFHHPLYSSAGRHGSETDLRLVLEPLFVKYGVNVVFSGHDHVYERIKPQKGIFYFVSGSAGQLRPGDLRRSALTEVGFDQDQAFMLVEVDKDAMSVQAITRLGRTVDSATIARAARKAPETTAAAR